MMLKIVARHWGKAIGLRVSILASGSSGNITLLETERTRLLIDAGLGKPTLGALQRALPDTLEKRLRGVEKIQAGQRFSVGDIEVHAFAIPHDAADPIGFTFRAGGVKLALVTDLGYMPELVKVHLRDADCLVLESNHDLDMLKVGPYPWVVKQRVLSRTGHLSNHAVSEYLADPDGFDGRARVLVLAHLSQENNNPDLARLSAEEALARRPAEAAFSGQLLVASQDVPLKPLQL